MRVDLTLCGPDGVDRDVAVLARAPVPFAEVAAAARTVLGPGATAQHWYTGRRPVTDEELLGGPGLRSGARLTCAPQPAEPPGGRVQVVGGVDGGAWAPLARRPVVVGRAPGCDLVVRDPDVSRRHVEVARGAGGVVVRDLGSTHGTWLGHVRIRGPAPWDSHKDWLRAGDTHLAIGGTRDRPATVIAQDGALVVRPGQRAAASAAPVLALPPPPVRARRTAAGWSALIAPSAAGVGTAMWTGSPQFLALALLSPLVLGAGLVTGRVRGRRRDRRSTADTAAQAARVRAEVESALREEIAARRRDFPDAASVLAIAEGPLERIWQRGRAAPELLRVRLGLADVPSAAQVDDNGRRRPAGVVTAVPAVVDLADGPLGLVGPPATVRGIARWVVAQLAVLASPADLRIEVHGDGDARWSWARWLPHTQRATAAQDAALVAVLGDPTAASVTGPAVCLASTRAELPPGCAHVASVANESGTRLLLDGLEVLTDAVDAPWAERVARALAPLAPPPTATGRGLPAQCRLRDVLGPTDAESIGRRWAASGGGCSAAIGLDSDPVELDLDRHGPHALVAGTTGAGKSQLLRTWVAALACTHPPDEIAFVLVDYKGGSAFAECAALPHTVGLVTDLDEHLTARALASLGAELRRRERLFAAASVTDLPGYRAAGGSPPLPRLMIVVDEFATLAGELPEFVRGLTGVAQRGRSLGLHLVLATQRPAGVVTAEVRANCSLRIALRVTDTGDSQDVIDGPQAASLPQDLPGRAYVLADGVARAVQVARTDLPAGASPVGRVEVRTLGPWRTLPASIPDSHGLSELATVVEAVSTAAVGRRRVAAPWLPPLPDRLSPDALATRDGQIAIGLVDLPDRQSQRPLVLDLGTGCSVLVVGAQRTGRTGALVTIALAAARRYGPDSLHVHAVDLRGDLRSVLDGLPHCGTVLGPGDAMSMTDALLHELDRPNAACELVLVDGWDEFARASQEWDGGRSLEQLLSLVRAARPGRTIAIAGDRSALSPRLGAAVTTRLLLRLPDRSDYALAGIPLAAVPSTMPPGRGLLAPHGKQVQLADPGSRHAITQVVRNCAQRWPQAPAAVRLRPLPTIIGIDELPPPAELVPFAVAGPHAHPLGLPLASRMRLLVTGPARSGRSTTLHTLLCQAVRAQVPVTVAAPPRSPLHGAASGLGVAVLEPDYDPAAVENVVGVLLVDDSEDFAETPLDDALLRWTRRTATHALVIAARTDDIARAYRGLAVEVRRGRCALLLQPGPSDGEVVGIRLARGCTGGPPGRGVLLGDPAWGPQFATGPVQVQVARAA